MNTAVLSGLPFSPNTINGYVYASYAGQPGSSYVRLKLHASFGDPARDIMSTYNHYDEYRAFNAQMSDFGNISLGHVEVCSYSLTASSFFGSDSDLSYFQEFSFIPGASGIPTKVKTQGNGSFKPIDLFIPRGFPVINANTPNTYSLSVSKDFNVDLKGLVSNYDSVCVRINSSGSAVAIQKTVAGDDSSVRFVKSELSNLKPGNYAMSFMVFNYSNITIENKVYVIELANRQSRYLTVLPL